MRRTSFILTIAITILFPVLALAAPPQITVSLGDTDEGLGPAIQIVILLTILTLLPSILIMMTSFTRLIIVFSLLRQALGVQHAPPNQVLIGMALFLTMFIMYPTFSKINTLAIEPYRDGMIGVEEALTRSSEPLKDFMLKNVREKELILFSKLSGKEYESKEELPFHVVVPAFVISELKTAFQIGFLIYLPFLVIDMVIASVLMSMGMMMLPPVMISLPFKLLLFVLVDGWYLLVGSLVEGFH